MKSLDQIQNAVRGNYQLKPHVFWFNLFLTAIIAHGAFWISIFWPNKSGQLVFFIISLLAHYRSIYFNHELSHTARQLSGFSWAYNLLFGFWTKFPTYIYSVHRLHHQKNHFATANDPEFSNIRGNFAAIYLIPIGIGFLIPVVLFVRFALLPMILLVLPKKSREWVYQNASAVALNPKFKRPLPNRQEVREWIQQDFFCWFYWWIFLIPIHMGVIPIVALWVWAALATGVFLFNHFRAMSAHIYDLQGYSQEPEFQIQKSITITKTSLWTYLWAPMGIQYHALHHLAPQIPYHELKTVHDNLASQLPMNPIYQHGLRHKFYEVMKEQSSSIDQKFYRDS